MTCYTAMITPFNQEGNLDEEGFEKNLAHQKPVDGLVVLGTTGEAPTLCFSEKKRLITLARTTPLHLMVGCGTCSTTHTLENLKLAADLGADSALVVTPYYNKPTQEGLLSHFKTLAQQSPLPIIIYNIQGRTSINMKTETLKKLATLEKIIGVKEASENLLQACEAIALKKERPDFQVYSGNDAWTLPLMALGGDGVISVASNLVPKLMKELVEACQAQNYSHAQIINHRLYPLFDISTFETNPIPIKAAMQEAGFAAGAPRLPLTTLQSSFLPALKAVVKGFQ